MGIEPTALAWEARVLPLYDARRSSRAFYDASARFHKSGRGEERIREWGVNDMRQCFQVANPASDAIGCAGYNAGPSSGARYCLH